MNIKRIVNLLKVKPKSRATGRDYMEVFSSERGRAILEDLIIQFKVGSPSVCVDNKGKVDLQKTALNEAAKTVVSYIVQRSDYDAELESRVKAQAYRERADKPSLPNKSNQA